jgi:fumarate hydratase class II
MGSKKPVHPNDHVNMSQSSNDTYPTAMHIACAEEVVHRLLPRWPSSATRSTTRPRLVAHHQDRPHPHPGRHPADARARSSGGYTAQVELGIERIEQTLPRLMELAQGGTAVGTGLNAPVGFAEQVADKIAQITACRSRPRPTSSRPWPPRRHGLQPRRDQHGAR